MDVVDEAASEDTSEPKTVGAQSLYAALGLSSEDVDALAQIPESEISVETLPYLIMQLKAKKTSSTTDTDHRGKSQDKLNTPERSSSDRRKSPSSSSSARRSGSHEHEHHSKREGHRKVERYTGGRKDFKYRKSSRERQSGDHVAVGTEFDDTPTFFPHKCSLCKCVLNSIKTWNEHLVGFRHKSHESKASPRTSRSFPSKRPYSSDPVIWDQFMSTTSDRLYPPKPNTRVVVAKFSMGAVTVEELLVLGKPFGTIVKHLVFPAKGFLEFSSHKEAQNMVSHFQLKPAFIKENRVILYLSPTVEGIHSPPKFDEPSQKRTKRTNAPSVVCFSRLPLGEGVEAEVLELAGMFGEVWQSKFTDCKALIEMVDWRDADIMVKYYYSNPLRIQGKSVKVAMSHITSLRAKGQDSSENSTEPPSRKSDSSKHSKQRDESTSSNKDKGDSSNQEATEKENQLMRSEDKALDNEEGIQLEDEPGPLVERTDDTVVNAEEEDKKGEEERMEEEEASTAEEESRERDSEYNQDERDDAEFPENIEDFVTLDELDNTAGCDSALDSSVSQDGKVVVVWPVKKAPDLMKDLCNLTAPFGSMVKHTLSMFKQEAMIELETDEKAQEMVRFYRDHKATICGRPVSITMCRSMKSIESPSGRSIFISCLPNQRSRQKYTKESLLSLVKPFGKLTAYSLPKHQATCYMQLDSAKAAEKMVAQYSRRPCIFWGSVLKIAMSRKGDSLIRWRYILEDTEEKELKKEEKPIKPSSERTENDQEIKSGAKENQKSSLPDCEGVGGDSVCERKGSEEVNEQDKPPLSPSQPDHIVGVNYVIPVTGFFCKLCNMFYTDENKAKSEHCRSLEHHNNFKLKHAEVLEPADGHPDG